MLAVKGMPLKELAVMAKLNRETRMRCEEELESRLLARYGKVTLRKHTDQEMEAGTVAGYYPEQLRHEGFDVPIAMYSNRRTLTEMALGGWKITCRQWDTLSCDGLEIDISVKNVLFAYEEHKTDSVWGSAHKWILLWKQYDATQFKSGSCFISMRTICDLGGSFEMVVGTRLLSILTNEQKCEIVKAGL